MTDTGQMLRLLMGYVGTFNGLMLTVLWGTLAVLSWVPFRARGVLWCQQMWGRTVLRAGGVWVAVRGGDQVDRSKAYVYVSNHQSGLDILVLSGHLPHRIRFVAKKELARVPFIGWALLLADQVLIDRTDRKGSMAALTEAGAKVASGKSVLIFPEGTRRPPRELWPFRRGAFVLARAAQVPIVPVGIVGSSDRMRARELLARPGIVGLRIGAPIPPEDFGDDDQALAERVRAEVARLAGPSATRMIEDRKTARRQRLADAEAAAAAEAAGSEAPPPAADADVDADEASA